MKKNFLKFLLSICILPTSVCNPLFANINIGESLLLNNDQYFITSTNTSLLNGVQNQNATIKGSLDNVDKVLEIDATEIEEEESENSFIKKGGDFYYSSATFYLLSLLFLFSFFTNNNRFQRLFTHFYYVNRRFVLFQVFRL